MKTSDSGKCVVIPYFDLEGKKDFERYRINPNWENKKKYYTQKGAKLIPYGLPFLKNFSDKYVILVEGESDYHAMVELGNIQVIGIPRC